MERARGGGYRVEIVPELVRSVRPMTDRAAYRRLLRFFRENDCDVVHTHSSKAGIIGRFAAWEAGVPHVVHTIHGLSFTASRSRLVNAAYVRLERLAAGRCHTIVSVADAMTRASLAAGIGRAEQYVTVHSGMEIDAFLNPPRPRDEVRRELELSDDDVAVVTVARLFEMKGHDDLITHAVNLCGRLPNLKFVWVGDGSLRPHLQSQISDLGLQDRFILTGLVPPSRVPELVNACDILAHPSRREGLARALPQGQLAGLPVVTYDVDGNAEGLIDGETGYAVPAFDVPQFAARVAELAADSDLRRRMGERGRTFAASRFSTTAMVRKLEAVYRRKPGNNR